MQKPIGRRENGKFEVWLESGELEGLISKVWRSQNDEGEQVLGTPVCQAL